MMKAIDYFIQNVMEIINNGDRDENPRPKYESDGAPAHSVYITQVFEKYNLANGEFPIIPFRPIPIFNGIKEIQWIYQDQSSDLSRLEGEYGLKWWRPWDIGDGTIGQRYGATVHKYDLMGRLLNGLVEDPFGRRHIINLWQEDDFAKTDGLLPCAFQTLFSVRRVDGRMYLDMTLIQRSSDYLVAGHINKMQYVALQMMIAKHCGYQVGVFAHFVQNLHIYERHIEQANEMLSRRPRMGKAILQLNVPDGTNFYDITVSDFELVNYNPSEPQLKFELGV